jgi:5-methylcytosine-specific restriction protein A
MSKSMSKTKSETKGKREFRKAPSLDAERVSRNLISGFLSERGFSSIRDEQRKVGAATSQTIYATSPDGAQLGIRVKLCWRYITKRETYAASQLIADVKNDDWVGTVQGYATRALKRGVTHILFVQPDGNQITLAALVPTPELTSVWCAQRDTSESRAKNGKSPTIWLYSKNFPAISDALWKHKGVVDLLKLSANGSHAMPPDSDDTFDDMPGIDPSLLGSDGAPRVPVVRSKVKRDPHVRTAVVRRAGGKCERCDVKRDFPGFLDVHHILGAEKGDRVWNCVALCPNCHREAHFSPNCEEMNTELLKAASAYAGGGNS